MFSKGQIIFAICFIVFFIVATVLSYKKDKKRHLKYYSGVAWILISFVLFLLFLFAVRYFLQKQW